MAVHDQQRQPRRVCRHLGYAIVISLLAVLAGYTGVLPIFRGHLMAYLGIDDAGFGQLFSLGPMAGVISILFGGVLLDRWGPRRLIHLGLLGVGGAMLLVAVGGRQVWVFAFALILAGLCAGPLFIAITAYLARLFPTHQRRVISLNLASSSLGGLLVPLVAEGLLALPRRTALTFAQVVHLPFILVGGLLLAGSLLYRPTAGSARTSTGYARPARWQWRDLALPPSALALAVLIALHGMADSILYFWMPRFLESGSFVTPLLTPGMVLAGYAVAYLLSRGLLALLPEHAGRRAFLVLPGLVGGGLLLAGILSRQYLLTAGGYILGALCWSLEYPALVSVLLRQVPTRFGAAMAVSGVLSSLGIALAMASMGRLTAQIGGDRMWQVMLVPAGMFLLVGLGGLAWLWRYDEHRASPPDSAELSVKTDPANVIPEGALDVSTTCQ